MSRPMITSFLGQRGLNMTLTNLKQIERMLPIINHPSESFKYMIVQLMFSTRKRELIFNNFKDFRREDIFVGNNYSHELTDVKKSLLCDTYNGYMKTLNKLESLFVTKIEALGTSLVKAETYHNWQSVDAEKKKLVFVKLTVLPHRSRLAIHKVVLRDLDIKNIIGVEVSKSLGNEKTLIALYTKVLRYAKLQKKANYSFLAFPFKDLEESAKYRKLQIYRNITNPKISEELDTFLTPVIFCSKTVSKITTKIEGYYAIVTIFKNQHTNLANLKIYFPQLKRELTSYLYISNKSSIKSTDPSEKILKQKIENLHSSFVVSPKMNQSISLVNKNALNMTSAHPGLLPTHPSNHGLSLTKQKSERDYQGAGARAYYGRIKDQPNSYQQYVGKMTSFLGDDSRILPPTHTQPTHGQGANFPRMFNHLNTSQVVLNQLHNQSINLLNPEHSLMNQTYLSPPERGQGHGLAHMNQTVHHEVANSDMTVLTHTQSERFKSQLYWEILVDSLCVLKRPRGKQILQMGASRNILKEIVFAKEILIHGEFYYFEVIAEYKDSDSILKPFKVGMFQNVQGIYFFMKIKNFTSHHESNDKINFFKAVELLELNFERETLVNIYVVRNTARLLSKRIYTEIKNLKNHDEIKKKFKLMDFLEPKVHTMKTLHYRICAELSLGETDKFLHIYRTAFLKCPPLLVDIYLPKDKSLIIFMLYNLEGRSLHRVSVPLERIVEALPFFHQLLQVKDYISLGKRLLVSFRNVLLTDYARGIRDCKGGDRGIKRGKITDRDMERGDKTAQEIRLI